MKQIAYVVDLLMVCKISDVKERWDFMNVNGLIIRYSSNAAKSVLIAEPKQHDSSLETFSGSGVTVTKIGQIHLGAIILTGEFRNDLREKVTPCLTLPRLSLT